MATGAGTKPAVNPKMAINSKTRKLVLNLIGINVLAMNNVMADSKEWLNQQKLLRTRDSQY